MEITTHWCKAYSKSLLYAKPCVQNDMLDFKEIMWHLGEPGRLVTIVATVRPLSAYRTLCSVTMWLLPSRGRVYFYHFESSVPVSCFNREEATEMMCHFWVSTSAPSWKPVQLPSVNWLTCWRDTWPSYPYHPNQSPANPLKQIYGCMSKAGHDQKTT